MKKYFIYLLTASIFTAQNIFAQSTTDAEGMDMSAYATWMGSGFLIMLFIMIGVFLFNAAKEPADPENIVVQASVFVKNQFNIVSRKSLFLLPNINIDLSRIRYLLTSALIIFSTILLLLIIQK